MDKNDAGFQMAFIYYLLLHYQFIEIYRAMHQAVQQKY